MPDSRPPDRTHRPVDAFDDELAPHPMKMFSTTNVHQNVHAIEQDPIHVTIVTQQKILKIYRSVWHWSRSGTGGHHFRRLLW